MDDEFKPPQPPLYIDYYGEEQRKHLRKVRREFGLDPLETKTRKCLRCDKDFQSEGKQNRMCYNCRTSTAVHEP